MRNIFRKQAVRQTDAEELDMIKKVIRCAESSRILGDISREKYEAFMAWADWRVSEMKKRV